MFDKNWKKNPMTVIFKDNQRIMWSFSTTMKNKAYIYIYIHTYMHTHIHIRMCFLAVWSNLQHQLILTDKMLIVEKKKV
jgi:hypothetical protein